MPNDLTVFQEQSLLLYVIVVVLAVIAVILFGIYRRLGDSRRQEPADPWSNLDLAAAAVAVSIIAAAFVAAFWLMLLATVVAVVIGLIGERLQRQQT